MRPKRSSWAKPYGKDNTKKITWNMPTQDRKTIDDSCVLRIHGMHQELNLQESKTGGADEFRVLLKEL